MRCRLVTVRVFQACNDHLSIGRQTLGMPRSQRELRRARLRVGGHCGF